MTEQTWSKAINSRNRHVHNVMCANRLHDASGRERVLGILKSGDVRDLMALPGMGRKGVDDLYAYFGMTRPPKPPKVPRSELQKQDEALRLRSQICMSIHLREAQESLREAQESNDRMFQRLLDARAEAKAAKDLLAKTRKALLEVHGVLSADRLSQYEPISKFLSKCAGMPV